MMQLVGAEVLDTAVARSLVVGQPEDEPNLRKKQGSKGNGEGSSAYVQFQGNNGKNYQVPRMSHEEIREHMTKKLRNGKRRMLIDTEVKAVVDKWADSRSEEEINQQVVRNEIKNWRRSWLSTTSHPWGTWRKTKEKGGAGFCTANSTTRLQAQCGMSTWTKCTV